MVKLSGGVARWQGVCYAAGMEFPREIVKRVVEIPGEGQAPALPFGYRLVPCGMVHDDQSKTTRLRFRAGAEDYPMESYEARAARQALEEYGTRVVQLESEIDHTHVVVYVTVAW
nr:MAG TPA: hypothetical protein [Caudoviricetes sp.]